MLGSLFSSACVCDISLDVESHRKVAALSKDKRGEQAYIYTNGEDVSGSAVVSVKPGKKVDHQGVQVELIGQIDFTNDKGGAKEFFRLSQDLEAAGTFNETKKYEWTFKAVDQSCETYSGTNVRLRYFVRLTVNRGYGSNVAKELDFITQNPTPEPKLSSSIRFEIAVEDRMHLECEYDKTRYSLKDVVVGRVSFRHVRVKIKHMELNIVRREATNSTAEENQIIEHETLTKYQVMDGAPVRDQWVAFRLYLAGSDLTPTYKNVQDSFSVRYFLNLVIVDVDERRYFKQTEVSLYRKGAC